MPKPRNRPVNAMVSKAVAKAKARSDAKAAEAAAPKKPPQPQIAEWLRAMAAEADAGNVQSFAAVIKIEPVPVALTNVFDPVDPQQRAAMIGNINLLSFMLTSSEHGARMAALAREIPPPPPQAQA